MANERIFLAVLVAMQDQTVAVYRIKMPSSEETAMLF